MKDGFYSTRRLKLTVTTTAATATTTATTTTTAAAAGTGAMVELHGADRVHIIGVAAIEWKG